jgi:fructose-1,6-bisphosphatase class 3
MTKDIIAESVQNDLRYLQLLARSFPTIADACTEIINLEAILNLPKGTEHFLSDLHGEDQAFSHVLRNASGAVKRKVNEIFSNTLRESEKKELCSLIYYPEDKLELIKSQEQDLEDWYQVTLNQLVRVCRNVSSKYTRSKVRKALPKEFSYIIQELLHESSVEPNKSAYVDQIICTNLHGTCGRFHYRYVQPDPTADNRPIAYHRRYLRSGSGRSFDHGYPLRLP